MKLVIGILLVAALSESAACTSSSSSGAPHARASGPPRIQPAIVARHAEQFDTELARRPAGSQQEEAAASYILAHLQQAGYAPRLEAVPVANTVNSTDVIAPPPSGKQPSTVVAVPYDTAPNDPQPGGDGMGLFLELARALDVARPDHAVELVALGAEHARAGGGYSGSRRLVELLSNEAITPLVITIEALGGKGSGRFGAFGPDAGPLVDAARSLHVPVIPLPPPDPALGRDLSARGRVYADAGLRHVAVTGGVQPVGRVLLEVLAGTGSG